MSDKQWVRTRRKIKAVYGNWEVALKAGMKVPWYIRFFSLFKKEIKANWIRRWTKGNREMMRHAMKVLSHEMEAERCV